MIGAFRGVLSEVNGELTNDARRFGLLTLTTTAAGKITAKATTALKAAIEEFPNYKKSKTIMKHLIDVNAYEEDADKLYIETMHKMFSDDSLDGRYLLAWTKTFDRLERCTDAIEHAADVIFTFFGCFAGTFRLVACSQSLLA